MGTQLTMMECDVNADVDLYVTLSTPWSPCAQCATQCGLAWKCWGVVKRINYWKCVWNANVTTPKRGWRYSVRFSRTLKQCRICTLNFFRIRWTICNACRMWNVPETWQINVNVFHCYFLPTSQRLSVSNCKVINTLFVRSAAKNINSPRFSWLAPSSMRPSST